MQSRKTCTPYFCKKQAHGTRCRRRSVNGTVSRNGSSQFSDAYSCDFKQLDLSNLCRKSCKNPFFTFSQIAKSVPLFFRWIAKSVPLFLRKIASKPLSTCFYVNFRKYCATTVSSVFCVISRAHAHAHARTRKCFLLELLSISCIVRRNEMENLQCLFSFKKFW